MEVAHRDLRPRDATATTARSRASSATARRSSIDVTLVAHDAGVRSDKLSDTVDYTRVATCVREVSTETRFNLIEALAAAIADALLASFDVSRVRVRVRKPEVELDLPGRVHGGDRRAHAALGSKPGH